MSFDYEASRKTASQLIANFGVKTQIHRVASTYDQVTGEDSVDSVAATDINLVSLPASKGTIQAFDNRQLEGLTLDQLRFFMVEALASGFEPTGSDLIQFDGKIWEIVGATPLNPSGAKNLLFNVGAKRSALTAIPTP